MPANPDVVAFVRRQRESASRSEREAFDAFRALSMEERGQQLAAVCRLAMEQVKASPHGERMLDWSEPPHPTYTKAIARIRRENPDWVFRMPEKSAPAEDQDQRDP